MTSMRSIWVITDGPDRSPDIRLLEERLSLALKHARYDVNICRSDQIAGLHSGCDAVLFFFPKDMPSGFETIRQNALSACRPSIPVQLGVFPRNQAAGELLGVDSILRVPAHPAQILQRLDFLFRLKGADRELSCREQTLRTVLNLDVKAQNKTAPRQLRCLFIGRPHPSFLTVMSAMQAQDIDIVAAFTSFTAFDYLHADKFDAAIINGIDDEEPALSIVKTIRRNSQLYNLPAILLTGEDEAELTTRYASLGFNDIINTGAELDELSGRICEHAGGHLMSELMRNRFESLDVDKILISQTGLYTKSYFEAHLRRLRAVARARNTPISVGVISVSAKPGQAPSPLAFRAACSQIGAMVKNLVRLQDFPAQLSASQFAIIFPETSEAACKLALNRLSEVISATAFDDYGTTFTLSVASNIVTTHQDQAPQQAIA